MRSIIITAALAAVMSINVKQAYPQDAWNMELIGKAAYDGGFVNYLPFQENLYIITGKVNPARSLFTVADISDPSLPDRVETIYEGISIRDFVVVDTLLYMTILYGGVVIYDIQNPSSPVELARLEDDRGFSIMMRLYNGYIISPSFGGLNVIDISDRLDPQIVNIIALEYWFMDFDIIGDYLVLAEAIDMQPLPHFLEIIDISDILNPAQTYFATLDSTEFYYLATLKAVGGYFYLCKENIEGIQVYGVNDPGEPQLVNTVFDDMVIADMAVSDDVIFAARNYDAILTIDISDPVNPYITNEFVTESVGNYFLGRNLSLSGDNLYFMTARDVISFLDVTDPNSPELQGRYFPGAVAYSAAKWGDYVYFSCHLGGVRIVDIGNPLEPVGVGSFGFTGSQPKLFIRDGILLITDDHEGVRILSLDNPIFPELLSTISTVSRAFDVYAVGNMLYIAEADGFSIYDISDPGNPNEIGYFESVQMMNYYESIISHGDFVYTAESDSGIGVYDITDPSTPIQVGAYSIPLTPSGFFYRENILYASAFGSGLLIIDVSDPSNPSLMGTAECELADDVFVDGNRAYIADRRAAFKVFDISDPYSPELIATYDDYGSGKGVYVENDTAYVAALNGGLWILRYDETVGIEDITAKPTKFQLTQNYPNPFNASTVFKYSLPESGNVVFTIYNLLGQRVATLSDGHKPEGNHSITWDASDFPSGVYFARLEPGDKVENIKMVLLK